MPKQSIAVSEMASHLFGKSGVIIPADPLAHFGDILVSKAAR